MTHKHKRQSGGCMGCRLCANAIRGSKMADLVGCPIKGNMAHARMQQCSAALATLCRQKGQSSRMQGAGPGCCAAGGAWPACPPAQWGSLCAASGTGWTQRSACSAPAPETAQRWFQGLSIGKAQSAQPSQGLSGHGTGADSPEHGQALASARVSIDIAPQAKGTEEPCAADTTHLRAADSTRGKAQHL